MEDKEFFLEPLFEKAEEYAQTNYELLKLKAIDKTADTLSTFVAQVLVIFVLGLFFILATIGMALWLGDMLGKSYYGFFCVAGLYAIKGALLYYFRNNLIKKYVSNSIISKMLN